MVEEVVIYGRQDYSMVRTLFGFFGLRKFLFLGGRDRGGSFGLRRGFVVS